MTNVVHNVMAVLLCYSPSYNHLLLVLYQFPVCTLQCAWLLCYATVLLTTTFFWFSISSLCVHYNMHGCSAMLLSVLQPPSSGSLSVPCVSATMCMAALLSYCPSYNHLLLVLYQFPVCPLQCAWLLCYDAVPLTTTFFWFSISSLCVYYNVHGCYAMLLSLLQPPSSGSLSVPCVSTTMCMVALLCYYPSYNHLLLVLNQFPVCPLQCAWFSAMRLSLLQPPSSGSLSVPCVSTTMCMVALLCYCPSYNHLLLVLYQFPVCPLKCAWLLCYDAVPLTTTFFWFSISSLCVHYNVHGCSAMLLSLLHPPSSGSLSVPCVSTTMCMAALLCYCPSYTHLLLVLYQFPVCLAVPCVSATMCMVALLCYCPSYNHLLLVLYQFPVCPLQCAWLLCYDAVPLTTTFFWFCISSLCVHYNVHGCSAILLSLLQPPSSGPLSVPCVSATMCMVALLCYCPSYNHLILVLYQFPVCLIQCAWLLCYATVPLTTTFFWFSISSLCVHYNVHGCFTMLLSLLQPPSSGSLSVPCVSTTMCMVALLCYSPSYNHLLLVLSQFPVCPL